MEYLVFDHETRFSFQFFSVSLFSTHQFYKLKLNFARNPFARYFQQAPTSEFPFRNSETSPQKCPRSSAGNFVQPTFECSRVATNGGAVVPKKQALAVSQENVHVYRVRASQARAHKRPIKLSNSRKAPVLALRGNNARQCENTTASNDI